MARLLLPLLAALALGATAPAHAQVLSGSLNDPAERPSDPGRDIQTMSSTYDPAGTWTVAARFYGALTAQTSALMRVYLATRAEDGTCKDNDPSILMAAYTDPADKGGKGMADHVSSDIVKTVDEDGRGFTLTFADSRLAQRGVCGVARTTLSRKESFDHVGAFAFPGVPEQAPPAAPAESSDTTPPAARMMVLRDRKAVRKGLVRVALLAASESMKARATLYGPGGTVQARIGRALTPNQMIRLTLSLRPAQLKRLKRTGRLAIEVVTQLVDEAGNQANLRHKETLRYRRG